MSAMRLVHLLVILALIAVFLPTTLAQDPPEKTGYRFDAPPYAIRGPYFVGTREFVLNADTERPLPGTIWYPALNPAGLEEVVVYDVGLAEVAPALNMWYGDAILDAVPDLSGGPYPLVIWSPGYGDSRFIGSFLLDHLVSYGFVVMAVDHTGNDLARRIADAENTAKDLYISLVDRPADVTRQIDYATTLTRESGEMGGLIDIENIGVAGLSLGGYTALIAVEAQLNSVAIQETCARHTKDIRCISMLENMDDMAQRAGLATIPERLWGLMGDPRIDVAVPIVPEWFEVFGTAGLISVHVPVMLITAGEDQIVDLQGQLLAFAAISSERTWVRFDNANHFIYGRNCPDVWASTTPIYCTDPVWDLDRAGDLMNHFFTAFMLAHLKGDADARSALLPENITFGDITYTTTMPE